MNGENKNDGPKCVFCEGNVVSDQKTCNGGVVNTGEREQFHCQRCGLVYAFPPPPEVSGAAKRLRKMRQRQTSFVRALVSP
jgi:hypothetical protein